MWCRTWRSLELLLGLRVRHITSLFLFVASALSVTNTHSCRLCQVQSPMLFWIATGLQCASFDEPKAATAAVCIAGQHRTFSTTSVTFARNFLHPTYTFFLSIGDDEQLDMDAAQRLSLTEERIARTSCIPPTTRGNAASPCSNRSVGFNYVQILCQAIKIGACVPLIELHVDTTGNAFEYVVHVRTDHRWLQPVPHVGALWRRQSFKFRVLAWDDHIHIAKYRDGLALFRAAPLAYSMCAGPQLWAAACNTTQRNVQLRMAMQKPPPPTYGFF